MTPTVPELRRQLDRMLRSRVFAERPRSAELLRYFVEQSIRNGFAPISQRAIAADALGHSADFSPAQSAAVRVKMARLRDALDRWYQGPGRGDPVVLGISGGPYRLVATNNRTPLGGVTSATSGAPGRCWWSWNPRCAGSPFPRGSAWA